MFSLKRWLKPKKISVEDTYRDRLNVFRSAFPEYDINAEALGQLAIFPSLRLCYNRLKKNANSTAMIALQSLEIGEFSSVKSAGAKRSALSLGKSTPSIPNDIREYDWLLIVRDPYSRTLSAFLQKFQMPAFREKYGNFDLTREGFADFLLWLKNGGLERNYHWNLQCKHMIFPISNYTKVIRFENFNDEFFRFINAINPAVSSDVWKSLSERGSWHATKSVEKLEHYYSKDSRKIVSELFRQDFLALDYPIKD